MVKMIKERMVTVDEFAEIAGATPRTIYNWSARRIIPPIKAGKLPLIASFKALTKYLAASRQGSALEKEVLDQRTRLMRARADIAKEERQALYDKLIPVAEIEEGWQYLKEIICGPFHAFPARVASRLVGVTRAAAAQAILTDEIYETLTAISTTPIDGARARRVRTV